MNKRFFRIRESQCCPIAPSEIKSWFEITGNIAYCFEYDILMAMDDVYCEEVNKEIRSTESKKQEEHKKHLEKVKQR